MKRSQEEREKELLNAKNNKLSIDGGWVCIRDDGSILTVELACGRSDIVI